MELHDLCDEDRDNCNDIIDSLTLADWNFIHFALEYQKMHNPDKKDKDRASIATDKVAKIFELFV